MYIYIYIYILIYIYMLSKHTNRTKLPDLYD